MTVVATILAQQFSGAFFVVWVVFFCGGYFLGAVTTFAYLRIIFFPIRVTILLGGFYIILNSWAGILQGLHNPWVWFYGGLVFGASRVHRLEE